MDPNEVQEMVKDVNERLVAIEQTCAVRGQTAGLVAAKVDDKLKDILDLVTDTKADVSRTKEDIQTLNHKLYVSNGVKSLSQRVADTDALLVQHLAETSERVKARAKARFWLWTTGLLFGISQLSAWGMLLLKLYTKVPTP